MLTIFSCPKSFADPHIAMIQRNAIRSWIALGSGVQVILVGDEAGIEQAAMELSCCHIPSVQRNEFGTPLLNDVFDKAERMACHNLLCYVNADIILMQDFMRAVKVAVASRKTFLLGGRVWNTAIRSEINFSAGWQDDLRSVVASNGRLRHIASCDYFVFNKTLWGKLPPYALGRVGFDNALLFRARSRGSWLIDATDAVMAVHQDHTYAPAVGGLNYHTNPEAARNIELAGGRFKLYDWRDATHVIRAGKLQRSWSGTLSPNRRLWQERVWLPLANVTRPVRHRLGLKQCFRRQE
jgi:hypothetical protein